MSDTRRHYDAGAADPSHMAAFGVRSLKHLQRDRPPMGRNSHSRGRKARAVPFSKHLRNDIHALLQKVESLRLAEQMEGQPEDFGPDSPAR